MLSQVWRYEGVENILHLTRYRGNIDEYNEQTRQRPVWLHFQLRTVTAYLLTVSLNSLYVLIYPAHLSKALFSSQCVIRRFSFIPKKESLLLLLTRPAFHSILVKVKRGKLQTQLNGLAYIEPQIEFMSCSTSYGLMNVQLWSGYRLIRIPLVGITAPIAHIFTHKCYKTWDKCHK